MTKEISGNYLRVYRRKAGLSQLDLAAIVGHTSLGQVGRHERNLHVPSLLTALAYEAVFDVPVSTLFIGLYDTVERGIELNLSEFEAHLQRPSVAGKPKQVSHRILWLSKRGTTKRISRPQL